MPDDECSNSEENVFVYKTEDNDLYFDTGDSVRFRVEAEEWCDQAPKGPKKEEDEKTPPYSIVVSQPPSSKHGFGQHLPAGWSLFRCGNTANTGHRLLCAIMVWAQSPGGRISHDLAYSLGHMLCPPPGMVHWKACSSFDCKNRRETRSRATLALMCN